MDTDQLAARFLRGYGIADCPIESFLERIKEPYRGHDPPLEFVDSLLDATRALGSLTELSWPASRHLVFETRNGCTAMLNNSRAGSDYSDYLVWLAVYLKAKFARIVCQDGFVWENDGQAVPMRYAATVFALSDPQGQLVRSVSCMDDGGRWAFVESGPRHPVEDRFPYGSKRIRDRFGPDQLAQLATAFEIPILQLEDLFTADRFYLIRSKDPPANRCTLAEADDPAYLFYLRGLSWTSQIETHAESLVADFEKCIELNPGYEPKVRDWLNKARKLVT